MTIEIYGKKVVITGKNARAYEKMNGFLPNENDVEVYVEAAVHPSDIKDYIAGLDESTLAELVNHGIEQEVRDCCGDAFYEVA